jgi:3-oxoacyl-[acyl-carrier-protein] synthase-3
MERFFVNVDRYGNTSAASIPIALDEARRPAASSAGDLHAARRVWGGLDLR